MDLLLYGLARAVIASLQALPLRFVARVGRFGGALAYWLDARHRRVILDNLKLCFGAEKIAGKIRALARKFSPTRRKLLLCCETAGMSNDEIKRVLEVSGAEKFYAPGRPTAAQPRDCHRPFRQLRTLTRACAMFTPGCQFATTYRALQQPALNNLTQSLREKSGCLFFERRTDADALKSAMNRGGIVLGLLADQHAGDKGLRLPFFGHDCSTSAAPAVLALRYGCRLFTAICYRTDLGRWRVRSRQRNSNARKRPDTRS